MVASRRWRGKSWRFRKSNSGHLAGSQPLNSRSYAASELNSSWVSRYYHCVCLQTAACCHRLHSTLFRVRWDVLQRTVFINKIKMPQRTVFINKIRMLQRTVFINKIRMLQRIQMLQRTRRNVIGRRSTRVRMMCRAFPLWLERQSSSLLLFVRFCYQFSSVICLFVQCIKVK
jgi:hypothetical protein